MLDRIVENGSPAIPIERKPMEPGRPALASAYPDADDDERMLRYMFAGSEVDSMKAAGPIKTTATLGSPVEALLRGLKDRRSVSYFDVEYKDTHVALRRTA